MYLMKQPLIRRWQPREYRFDDSQFIDIVKNTYESNTVS